MEPVDLLMNCTFNGEVPEVTFVVKLGTGAAAVCRLQ